VIYIVEGIPGAGKDIYVAALLSRLVPQARLVYAFDEGSILYSWKHYSVPNVDMLCLHTIEAIVQHVKATQPDADFVFDRFHLFVPRARAAPNSEARLGAELQTRYRQLVDELRLLPVHIRLATLEKHEMEARRQTSRAQRGRLARVPGAARRGEPT